MCENKLTQFFKDKKKYSDRKARNAAKRYNKARKEGLTAAEAYKKATRKNPLKKPNQIHHYATNKRKIFTPKFKSLLKRYKLDLDEDWNKESLPHQGRYPKKYQYILHWSSPHECNDYGDKAIYCIRTKDFQVFSEPSVLYRK